jgi:hypothetical protein
MGLTGFPPQSLSISLHLFCPIICPHNCPRFIEPKPKNEEFTLGPEVFNLKPSVSHKTMIKSFVLVSVFQQSQIWKLQGENLNFPTVLILFYTTSHHPCKKKKLQIIRVRTPIQDSGALRAGPSWVTLSKVTLERKE